MQDVKYEKKPGKKRLPAFHCTAAQKYGCRGYLSPSVILYSCPNPSVSSTAMVILCSKVSWVLYGGRSRRLKQV